MFLFLVSFYFSGRYNDIQICHKLASACTVHKFLHRNHPKPHRYRSTVTATPTPAISLIFTRSLFYTAGFPFIVCSIAQQLQVLPPLVYDHASNHSQLTLFWRFMFPITAQRCDQDSRFTNTRVQMCWSYSASIRVWIIYPDYRLSCIK